MKRAAIYIRVSTPKKNRQNKRDLKPYEQNPEVQARPLHQVAGQREWSIVKVYADRISGAKETRPAFDEMMADARRGKFDVVMIWHIDRLSRSALHFLKTATELRAIGVDLYSYQQSLDTTTPIGQFCVTMLAAVAELERGITRERIIAGLEYAQEHGTKSGNAIGRPKAVFDRTRVVELRNAGKSWGEIAAALNVGTGTVRRAYGEALPKPVSSAGGNEGESKAVTAA
jgi:DNA invertase Pin-like site-specific DNA recombinase